MAYNQEYLTKIANDVIKRATEDDCFLDIASLGEEIIGASQEHTEKLHGDSPLYFSAESGAEKAAKRLNENIQAEASNFRNALKEKVHDTLGFDFSNLERDIELVEMCEMKPDFTPDLDSGRLRVSGPREL
jgi:hypothetical protein